MRKRHIYTLLTQLVKIAFMKGKAVAYPVFPVVVVHLPQLPLHKVFLWERAFNVHNVKKSAPLVTN